MTPVCSRGHGAKNRRGDGRWYCPRCHAEHARKHERRREWRAAAELIRKAADAKNPDGSYVYPNVHYDAADLLDPDA